MITIPHRYGGTDSRTDRQTDERLAAEPVIIFVHVKHSALSSVVVLSVYNTVRPGNINTTLLTVVYPAIVVRGLPSRIYVTIFSYLKTRMTGL